MQVQALFDSLDQFLNQTGPIINLVRHSASLRYMQRRLEPETLARDLGRPRAICAMLGMQSEVCNHTLYHR